MDSRPGGNHHAVRAGIERNQGLVRDISQHRNARSKARSCSINSLAQFFQTSSSDDGEMGVVPLFLSKAMDRRRRSIPFTFSSLPIKRNRSGRMTRTEVDRFLSGESSVVAKKKHFLWNRCFNPFGKVEPIGKNTPGLPNDPLHDPIEKRILPISINV